jgi:hypothetical protein
VPIAAIAGAIAVVAKAISGRPTTTARSHAIVAATELVTGLVATPPSGLPDGEISRAALFLLAFDTRELRANQLTMDRTFLGTAWSIVVFLSPISSDLRRRRWFGRGFAASHDGGTGQDRLRDLFGIHIVARIITGSGCLHWGYGIDGIDGIAGVAGIAIRGLVGRMCLARVCVHRKVRVRLAGQNFLVERGRRFLLLATGGVTALVGMFGVAGRTPSLLDGLFDHGDYGVIRQATLTRAVVIQNVSKTQPALLHSISPELCPLRGAGKDCLGAGSTSLAEPLSQAQD